MAKILVVDASKRISIAEIQVRTDLLLFCNILCFVALRY